MDSRITNSSIFKDYFDTSRGDIEQPKQEIVPVPDYDTTEQTERYTSQDNIDDIDRTVELIRVLLEKAWNEDCPVLVDQYPTGTDPTQIQMPMIIYDYYDRKYKDNSKRAPTLMQVISINGETYEKCIEHYVCKLQFDICDTSMRAAKILTKKFEDFLKTYIPYLKYIGVQQMEFYEEPKARPFQAGNQEYPRRTLIYNVQLERQYLKRQGDEALNNIQVVLGIAKQEVTDGIPGINILYDNESITTIISKEE